VTTWAGLTVFDNNGQFLFFLDCDGKDADIYFVLDASNSIWPEDFKQQLSFVNNVIDIFKMIPNLTVPLRVNAGANP
jgi:hypothetical protein